MVMVYDYHPASVTLMTKYLSGGTNSVGPSDTNGPSYHDPFSSDPDAPRPYTHQVNIRHNVISAIYYCNTTLEFKYTYNRR